MKQTNENWSINLMKYVGFGQGDDEHSTKDQATKDEETSLILHSDKGGKHAKETSKAETSISTSNENLLSQKQGSLRTIDDAIDQLGMGRFQIIVLFAAGLCFAADATEVLLLSFLSQVLQQEWDLDETQTASITSCVFAGALSGSLLLGPAADKWGRRPVFLFCAVVISIFGFLTALVKSFELFLIVRFLVGMGIGGLAVPFDVLAEFLPSEQRGKFLLLIEYFWTAGSLTVACFAYISLRDSWESFVMLCSIPCFLSAIIGSIYVPESPRWLISQGKSDEAMKVLRYAARMNGHDPDVMYPQGMEIDCDEMEEESSNMLDLFKPKWRKIVLLIMGVWTGFGFHYYGTIELVVRIFSEMNPSSDTATTTVAAGQDLNGGFPTFDYGAIIVSSSAEILGVLLVSLSIDRFGRVRTQVVSYALGALVLYFLCTTVSDLPNEIVVCAAFLARVFEMGGCSVSWVATAELLGTEIRGTGHSAANAMARLGGLISPYVVQGKAPLHTVGVIFLGAHLFTILCASNLPESKDMVLGSSKKEISSSRNDASMYQMELRYGSNDQQSSS